MPKKNKPTHPTGGPSTKGRLKLSDNEIRDITSHLEASRPLPDKYRFLLFEDKRWNRLD